MSLWSIFLSIVIDDLLSSRELEKFVILVIEYHSYSYDILNIDSFVLF